MQEGQQETTGKDRGVDNPVEQEIYPEENEEEVEEESGEVVTSSRRGCVWGCLAPIAIFLAVIMILGIFGYSRRDSISSALVKRIVNNTQVHVLSQLPEESDSQEVENTFERVRSALKEDKIDQKLLVESIEKYHDIMQSDANQSEKNKAIEDLMDSLNLSIEGNNP
ncbi:hypothetical protein GF312_21635 [Candidatus Poribacteria bacterium]|nr:hypothetical protein [Candidatus Poribacteria bacterium]